MQSKIHALRNFLQNQFDKGANIISPKSQFNDDGHFSFYTPKEIEIGDARVIEGGNQLDTTDVNIDKKISGFSYFLDGKEKKKVFIIDNKRFQIPITYGYVSAVILKRENKKLIDIGLIEEDSSIYLPYKEIGDEPDHYFNKKDVMNSDINTVNIGVTNEKGKRKGYPIYPSDFEASAHSQVQTRRGNLEQKLVEKWLNESYEDGWLYLDGRLEPVNKHLSSNSKIVGVVKSHDRIYFSLEEQSKIYSLEKGQRTTVFIPDNKNVFSWYLRLYENKYNGTVILV